MIKKSTLKMMRNKETKLYKQVNKSAKWNEGYADVDYEDVWNLNDRLANIISKHLHAFLKAVKGPYGGYPAILTDTNPDVAYQRWLQIIRDIIYAFDHYSSGEMKTDADQSDPHVIEVRQRVKEGMQLFIDYFDYLWI